MSIARSTALVSGLTLLAHGLGFLAQVLFARSFGAGSQADAWFAAVAVPNFLAIALFASLAKACLPVFVKRHQRVGEIAFRGISGLANLTFVGLVLLALLVTLAADPVARLLFPAFDPERFSLARDLLRISIWAVPPVGAALILASALQGLRRFGVAAAAGFLQPLSVLLCLLLLRERFGVASMAIGLVAGSWLMLVFLLPLLLVKQRYRPSFALDDPGLRRVARLFLPLLAAAAIIAVYPLLEKRYASRLPAGAISWLDYARKPLTMLIFLVGGPAAITSYTAFAESAARKDLSGLRSQAWRAALILSMVMLPIGIFLGIHAEEVLRLIFERGRFSRQDTDAAAAALLLLLPIALLGSAGKVLVHAFLARGKVAAPLLAAAAGLALYVTIGGTVAERHGYLGLATLQTAAVGTTIVLAVAALLVDLGLPRGEGLIRSGLGVALAGIAAGAVFWAARELVPSRHEPAMMRAFLLTVTAFVGGAVYLGVLSVTRNPHLAQLLRSLFGATSPRE